MPTYTKLLSLDERVSNFHQLLTLVGDILPRGWGTMLSTCAADTVYEEQLYLGFVEAPAAKANHHACLGGLVAHYLEMWAVYKSTDFRVLGHDPLINDVSVLSGIILHDLHKAWCHFVADPAAPNGVTYGKHPVSSLLTPDQKTVYIASRYVSLDIIQLNAVYHSEGGWAASPPKWGSVLSKFLYLLDEISSNVADRTARSSKYVQVFGDKGNTTKITLPIDL